MRLEVNLARLFSTLSDDEKRVYDSLDGINTVLNNGSDLDELRACRDGKLGEAYGIYDDCRDNRFKPYFHASFHAIAAKVNRKIKALEESR